MIRIMPTWTYLAMALTVPAWLLAVPAAAQGSHAGGGGGGHAASSSGGSSSGGSSSGGSSSGGGQASSGGGGHASGGGGGGSQGGGGGRTSGIAVSRGGGSSGGSRSSGDGGRTRGSAERGPGSAPTGSTASGVAAGGSRSGGRAVTRGSAGDSAATGGSVPQFSRPRDGRPTIGQAVPRTGGAPGSAGAIVVPGYYGGYFPWGFAGLGFAGYYGSYYGSYYGGYYDPYGFGGGLGDPYDSGYGDSGGYTQYPERADEGALRLKLKPRGAAVYVDGSYAGVVDDFDGVFQKLHLDGGPHHVEVRMAGFETLAFDVSIESNHTTTYHGELSKVPQ